MPSAWTRTARRPICGPRAACRPAGKRSRHPRRGAAGRPRTVSGGDRLGPDRTPQTGRDPARRRAPSTGCLTGSALRRPEPDGPSARDGARTQGPACWGYKRRFLLVAPWPKETQITPIIRVWPGSGTDVVPGTDQPDLAPDQDQFWPVKGLYSLRCHDIRRATVPAAWSASVDCWRLSQPRRAASSAGLGGACGLHA
jgi:hypothetical protein